MIRNILSFLLIFAAVVLIFLGYYHLLTTDGTVRDAVNASWLWFVSGLGSGLLGLVFSCYE